MELSSGLLYVSVAIAFVGSVKGDATSDAGATECSLVLEEGKSANETTYDAMENCYFDIGYEHLGRNPTDEAIRTTIATYCGKTRALRECLDGVESNARACLDETQRTRYGLYRRFRELDFEIGCEDNGADIAVIYRSTFYGENTILKGCQENATARVEEMDAVDPNAFVLHKYREMRKTVECLEGHKRQGDDSHWAITMGTKIMDRMKCVKDGADVLCKTIVDDH